MDAEVSEFLQAIGETTSEEWRGFRFHRGELEGKPVVIGKAGVGKSLSALVTQHLCEHYRPARLIFTGLAGAIDPALEVGDTVIAEESLQYDLDASPLGFAVGEVPFTDYRFMSSDRTLVRLAQQVKPVDGKAITGRIGTGDRFLSQRDRELVEWLRSELRVTACEMEGASVALAAAVNDVPFLLVRTISDRADGTAPKDFNAFLRNASRNSLAFVRQVLAGLR